MVPSPHARHPGHRRSGGGDGGPGARAESTPLRAGRARLGGDVGHAGRPGPAEGQLPPARAGGARAGAAGPGSEGRGRLARERKGGGTTERLLVATAASYVVSPSALGPVAVDPNREVDRLSASYLIALGARVVREMADLIPRATEAGKRLATLAVDTEVRFRSATERAAFSNELTEAIAKLVSKYHDESAPGGRVHRLVVVAHPLPQKSDRKEPS